MLSKTFQLAADGKFNQAAEIRLSQANARKRRRLAVPGGSAGSDIIGAEGQSGVRAIRHLCLAFTGGEVLTENENADLH
ncbi:MAG: hypothetical protein M3R60_17850 [Pseudomonadota bacterium]|nr:hypothetical protein [Pseudomonadota bacterium]